MRNTTPSSDPLRIQRVSGDQKTQKNPLASTSDSNLITIPTRTNSEHSTHTSRFLPGKKEVSLRTTTDSLSSSPPLPPTTTTASTKVSRSIPLPVRTPSAEFSSSFENCLSFGSSSYSGRRRRQREEENNHSFVNSLETSTENLFEHQEQEESEEMAMLWRRMWQAVGQSAGRLPSVNPPPAFPAATTNVTTPSASISTGTTASNTTILSSSSPLPTPDQIAAAAERNAAKRRKGAFVAEPLSVLGMQIVQQHQLQNISIPLSIPIPGFATSTTGERIRPKPFQHSPQQSLRPSTLFENSPPNIFQFDEEIKNDVSPRRQSPNLLVPQPQRVSVHLVDGLASPRLLVGSRHSLSRSLSRSQFEEDERESAIFEEDEKATISQAAENNSPNAVLTIEETQESKETTSLSTSLSTSRVSLLDPSTSAPVRLSTSLSLKEKEKKNEKEVSQHSDTSACLKMSKQSFMYEMISTTSPTTSRWCFEVSWRDVWMVAVELGEPHSFWLIFYHATTSGKTKEGALRIPIDEEKVPGSEESFLEALESRLSGFEMESYLQVMDCAEDVGHIVTVWKEGRRSISSSDD